MDNFLFIIFLLVLLVVYFVKTKKYKRLLETIGIYVIANNEETILVWSNDRKIIKLIPDEGFIVPWHNKMILNLSTNHLVVPSGKQVDKNGKTPYVNIVVSYKVIHNCRQYSLQHPSFHYYSSLMQSPMFKQMMQWRHNKQLLFKFLFPKYL